MFTVSTQPQLTTACGLRPPPLTKTAGIGQGITRTGRTTYIGTRREATNTKATLSAPPLIVVLRATWALPLKSSHPFVINSLDTTEMRRC